MIDDLSDEQRTKYFIHGNDSLTVTKIKNKMDALYKFFKDSNIPAILYCNSFDKNMFDNRGNETFADGKTYKIGSKGKKKDYIQPKGWIRYGLNVLDGRYGSDNTWLHPFNHPKNWYRVYIALGSVNSMDNIPNKYKNGFNGPIVYCSPDPVWMESKYCGTFSIDTKYGKRGYKCMLQCCVNPDDVECGKKKSLFGSRNKDVYNPIWTVKNPKSIRIYGILIKATKEQRQLFNENSKAKKAKRNKNCVSLNKDSIKKKIETIKKAEQITNDILSKKPSGDPGDKDTVLHLFNEMSGGNALFYDSSKGVNCPDNENILMNQNMLRSICIYIFSINIQ